MDFHNIELLRKVEAFESLRNGFNINDLKFLDFFEFTPFFFSSNNIRHCQWNQEPI